MAPHCDRNCVRVVAHWEYPLKCDQSGESMEFVVRKLDFLNCV